MSEPQCGILQLSDCAMMYILSYLDATSLFNLSRTCAYFRNIVQDPQLWRYIDARQEPNSTKKVNYVCDRVHDKTSHILLRAESRYIGLLPQCNLIGWSGLDQLTVLALENQRFNGRSLSLQSFPKGLEELSLRKTHIKNAKTFFQGSFNAMRNLKVLILDECDWLDSNFFMSVAKYENLEILSIVKCMKLHLNVVPYLHVARLGCKQLKVLDCRFNTIANEIVSHAHKSLVGLYLQSMSSYELDKGTPLTVCPPQSFISRDLMAQHTVKSQSLEPYTHLVGDLIEEIPQSQLYVDPYPECSCDCKNRNDSPSAPSETQTEPKSSMEVDDYIDFHLSPQRFICSRHIKELNTLPHDFMNFNPQNNQRKCPDSSDNDSDSDEDKSCCMFGVGKSQMIVLKLREADESGHMPQPEVIDIFGPASNVINIDVNVNINQERADARDPLQEPDPQPSTSRHHHHHHHHHHHEGGSKRKARDDRGNARKRRNADPERIVINHYEPIPLPGPSRSREREPGSPLRASGVHISGRHALRVNIRGSSPIRLIQDRLLQPRENPQKIKMRRLSLRGYQEITDDALVCIQNLNLDLLDVTYTKVTKEGVSKFLNLNPNCRVLHADYCVCKPRIMC